jgi:hypothetical protein
MTRKNRRHHRQRLNELVEKTHNQYGGGTVPEFNSGGVQRTNRILKPDEKNQKRTERKIATKKID